MDFLEEYAEGLCPEISKTGSGVVEKRQTEILLSPISEGGQGLGHMGNMNLIYLAEDTRDEAYRSIQRELSDRQKAVFDIIRRGDRSNTEIASALGWPINRVTPRVFELRQLGLVFPNGKAVCPITLRRVQKWTARKPNG